MVDDLAKRKLTAKQERFAQLVASGEKYSPAYRLSHDANGSSDQTVWVHASQLAANDKVATRIDELVERYASVAEIDASYVLQRVKGTAEMAQVEGEYSPALKGYELLGRHVGLFSEHSTVDVRVEHALEDATRDDILTMLADLKEQRLALQASAEVIDDDG
jgi:hypothetical protein